MEKRKEIREYEIVEPLTIINGDEDLGWTFNDTTKSKVINIDVAIKLLNKAKSQGDTHIEIEVGVVSGKDTWGDSFTTCPDVDVYSLNFRYQTPTEELKEKSKEAVKKAIKSEIARAAAVEREKIKKAEKEAAEKATYLKLKQKFEK